MRTGTLHDSIEADAPQDEAVIGSDDRGAVDQELGTRTISPRPYLAPAAAREAEGSARSVSEVIVNAIRGMLR
jgi:phage gpG-like protein